MNFLSVNTVNPEILTAFTRQLAILLRAGVPLLRSLDVLAKQEKTPAFRRIIQGLAAQVRSGDSLSECLAQHPRVFDRLYMSMVRAGETGGVLDVVLSRLALFREKNQRVRRQIQTAMVYPVLVMTIAAVIVVLLILFVVPKFEIIYSDLLHGTSLPLLTRIVVYVSLLFQKHFLVAAGLLIALWAAVKFAGASHAGARFFDLMRLRLPVVGALVVKIAVARFSRTFGTLLDSGVPILDALIVTRDVVGNRVIMEAVDVVHDRVRDGETVTAPLERTGIFPALMTSMIDVGEETGELGRMLGLIADSYEEDVDHALGSLTSIIEPVMILLLALVVGTIVIALFLPIIDIIQRLGAG